MHAGIALHGRMRGHARVLRHLGRKTGHLQKVADLYFNVETQNQRACNILGVLLVVLLLSFSFRCLSVVIRCFGLSNNLNQLYFNVEIHINSILHARVVASRSQDWSLRRGLPLPPPDRELVVQPLGERQPCGREISYKWKSLGRGNPLQREIPYKGKSLTRGNP